MEYLDLCYFDKEFKKLQNELNSVKLLLTALLETKGPAKPCSFNGCKENAITEGVCSKHYKMIYK